MNQDDGGLYDARKISYVQDEAATGCTARHEPFLVINFTKKEFIFLENLETIFQQSSFLSLDYLLPWRL